MAFDSRVTYNAGDVLMILPKNDHSAVMSFIELLGLEAGTLLRISVDESQLGQVSATSLIQFPQDRPISAYELFAYWLNITDAPSRHFCEILDTFLLREE